MKYVAYYRVSTKRQGLGLEAQRNTVKSLLKPEDELIAEFSEKESGTNNNRPALKEAIELCKETGATIFVAKLDRITRDVGFLRRLQDSGLDLKIADMPDASKLTLHIYIGLAEHELDRIKDRTVGALDQIKRNIEEHGFHISKKGNRITRLGGSNKLTDEDREKGKKVLKERRTSNENNKRALSVLRLLKEKDLTLQEMANYLNENNYRTSRNKEFSPTQVSRLLKQI